jgi:hypothetical protein
MDQILEKVTQLGGITYTDNRIIYDSEERKLMMDCFDLTEQSDYVKLLDAIGGSYFNNDVSCTGLEHVPGATPKGVKDIGIFIGFIEGAFGISEIQELVEDNMPEGYLPFILEVTGDYWVYELSLGKIYFWHHESPEDEDLYFVADNLTVFFEKLIIKDADQSGNKITDFWIADDL